MKASDSEPSGTVVITFVSSGECLNGTQDPKIFQEGVGESRPRNEEAQRRRVEERALRPQGQEPQAGHRDRIVGSPRRRRQGAEETKGGEEAEGEAVATA